MHVWWRRGDTVWWYYCRTEMTPWREQKAARACKIAKKRAVHITHQTLVLKSRKVY